MTSKKILAAIDKAPFASVVFEQALQSAQKERASLIVFHCISSLGLSDLALLRDTGAQAEQAQEWMQPFCEQAKGRDIAVECVSKLGLPGPSICNVAERWGANLIVLGRKDQPALAKMLLGSVSNHVVRHAPCPVLVVQE